MKYLSLSVILLALFLSVAQAAVYKWVDENGLVHYGEKPTNHAIEIDTSRSEVDPNQLEQALERNHKIGQELEFYKRVGVENAEQEAEQAKQKAEIDKKCKKVKKALDDYDRGGYVWAEKGKNGEDKYVSDTEMKNRTDKLRKKYKSRCG